MDLFSRGTQVIPPVLSNQQHCVSKSALLACTVNSVKRNKPCSDIILEETEVVQLIGQGPSILLGV